MTCPAADNNRSISVPGAATNTIHIFMRVIILNGELNYWTYVRRRIDRQRRFKSPYVAAVWILNEISYLFMKQLLLI